MTEIYLIRHPESVINADPTLVGGRSNHVAVTERGMRQAQLFARAFASEYPSIDVVYSSPAVRTKTLAEAYLEEIGRPGEYIIEPDIQEMTHGPAEGQLRTAIYTPEVLARINEELFDFKHPEGESLNEVADRVLAAIRRAHEAHPGKTVLFSMHGQAIRAGVGRLLGWNHFDTTRNPETHTPNTAVAHLSVSDESITVHSVNKVIINESDDSLGRVY
jgi:broad specificity phosphatase PhoE